MDGVLGREHTQLTKQKQTEARFLATNLQQATFTQHISNIEVLPR